MQKNQQELFTELTPEEGSGVQGGSTVQLRFLTPKGRPGQNDPMIYVGTRKKWGRNNVNTTRRIFKNIRFDGDTTLSIWDRDNGRNSNDLLGYVKLSGRRTGIRFLNVPGYRLSYRVRA